MKNRASWPDLVGLTQGTGDILEAAGIIQNDRLIVSWDGSYIAGLDPAHPRTIITIAEWLEFRAPFDEALSLSGGMECLTRSKKIA